MCHKERVGAVKRGAANTFPAGGVGVRVVLCAMWSRESKQRIRSIIIILWILGGSKKRVQNFCFVVPRKKI